jgi:hypothetical protein
MKTQLYTWGARYANTHTLRIVYAVLALAALVLGSGAPSMFGD